MRVSVSLFRPRVTRNHVTTVCKIWHAAWRDPQTGRRCTKTTGTSNRQSAQQFAVRLQDKLYRQSIGAYDPAEDHRDMAFSDAVSQFLQVQSERLRPPSVLALEISLNKFTQIMKPKELRKIDRRVVDEFVTRRLKSVEGVTVNKDLRHIRSFLNWCRRQSYIASTPDFKGLFLIVDVADPTQVSSDDVKSVLNALKDESLVLSRCSRNWWGVFIRVALFTGMRRSELLGLRWSHVDFHAGKVQVIRSTSKGRRDRLYESASSLTDMLRDWFDSQSEPPLPSDYVLPFKKDPRGLYVDWDAILEHAGIPPERHFTPHDCRATCCSELLATGVALTTVRDWVGHSSVAVTERYYASTRSDRLRVAAERKVM
jgi:integrase